MPGQADADREVDPLRRRCDQRDTPAVQRVGPGVVARKSEQLAQGVELGATGDARSGTPDLECGFVQQLGDQRQAKGAFGVSGFPESFVIDRQGRVAALERGPVNNNFMAQTVIPLLRERS